MDTWEETEFPSWFTDLVAVSHPQIPAPSFQSLSGHQGCPLCGLGLRVAPSRDSPSARSCSCTFLVPASFPFHTDMPRSPGVPVRRSPFWCLLDMVNWSLLNSFQKSESVPLASPQILSGRLSHVVKVQQRSGLVVTQVPKGPLKVGIGSEGTPAPCSAGGRGVADASTGHLGAGARPALAEQSWRRLRGWSCTEY